MWRMCSMRRLIFFLRQFGFWKDCSTELITKLFLLSLSCRFSWDKSFSPRVSQLVVQGNLSRARQKMAYIFPLFFLLFAFVAILLFSSSLLFQSFFQNMWPLLFFLSFFLFFFCCFLFVRGVFFYKCLSCSCRIRKKLLLWGAILSVMINFFFDSILWCLLVSFGIFLNVRCVFFSVIIQTLWGFFGKIHQPSVRNAVPHE